MEALKDFRIDAWFEQGLMTRWKELAKRQIGSLATAGAFIAAAAFTPVSVSLPMTPTASTIQSNVSLERAQAASMQVVERIGQSIEEQLATLGSRDHSRLNPERFALAQKAIAALAARRQERA